MIEQEASVLRSKVQNLESENDKLTAENKRLSLLRNTKAGKLSDKNLDKCIDQIAALEIDLADANKKIKQLESNSTIIGEFKVIYCPFYFLF